MIPDDPIQAPERSTFAAADTVADAGAAAFARRNLGTMPKSNHHQPNVKRTRRKEINAPEPDLHLSDTDDESVDEIHGEKFDNCPQDLPMANSDGESTNGPHSPKSVSQLLISPEYQLPADPADQMTIRCTNVHFRP